MRYNICVGGTHNIKKEIKGLFPAAKDSMVISDWPEFDLSLLDVFELNFQEKEDISAKNHIYWEDSLMQAKKANPDVILTAHSYFISNKNKQDASYASSSNEALFKKKPLNMGLEWLVVPSEYKDPFVSEIKSADLNVIKQQIDFCYEHGVKNLTIHVTKPGVYLSDSEFETFIKRINELDSYSRQQGKQPLTICVETGGLKPSQIEKLLSKTEDTTKINYDTAHAILDNAKMDGEKFTLNFIDSLIKRNRLGEVHLCEVVEGADIHAAIYLNEAKDFKGELKPTLGKKMNAYILRRLSHEYKKDNAIPIVLETRPDTNNFGYIRNCLEPANLIIVCGLQGSGKTTVATKLSEQLNAPILGSDSLRKELLDTPSHSEEERQLVYSEMFSIARDLLLENKNVVLDATFYRKDNREDIKRIAQEMDINVIFVETVCPETVVKDRLDKREEGANFENYLECRAKFEPVKDAHIVIDTSEPLERQIKETLKFIVH